MTEENNMSSEEQELAQEALDAASTEEKSPEVDSAKEPTVPLHEHTALRGRAQVAELKAANLEGQLSQLQQTTEQTVKSPVELAMEAEGVDSPDDLERPFAVFQAQQTFEKQQAQQASIAETATATQTAQLASTELAKGVHDDWQEVVTAAFKHMTKGEILDIESERDNFGEVAYAKAQQVLDRVKPVTKTAPETELSKSEAEAKVKADAEAKAKADAEKVPSQDEVLKSDNPRISHVMNL